MISAKLAQIFLSDLPTKSEQKRCLKMVVLNLSAPLYDKINECLSCLLKMVSDRAGNFISKIDGDGITNHFISIVRTCIYKLKIIWESLNTGNFPYGHASIQIFFSFYKTTIILSHLHHFRCLWMKLALPPRRLHSKCLLIP